MPTDLEILEAENARKEAEKRAEKEEQYRRLLAENERLRENQRGQPLPGAATIRSGYAQTAAEREAKKAGEQS
jgi:hypothetical protein